MLECLRQFWSRTKALFLRRRLDRDLEAELRLHLELRTEELEKEGISGAGSQARRSFGNTTRLKEDSREAWTFRVIEELRGDFRYSVRTLLRSPWLTLTVVVMLGISIGLNSAIFSFVDAVWLRPLSDIREPDRLVHLYGDVQATPEADYDGIAYLDYLYFAENSTVAENIVAYARWPLNLATRGDPVQRRPVAVVSGNYFDTLGTPAALGRTLSHADDNRAAPLVGVISYGLWRDRFREREDVIGQTITLNNHALTIVGVAPETFAGAILDWTETPDIWVPIAHNTRLMGRDLLFERRVPWHQAFARLKPGVGIETARQEFELLAGQLAESLPETNEGQTLTVLEATDVRFWPGHRESIGRYLLILLTTGALLLLIACFNTGNLLLARAATRRREWSIRTAIGAPTSRLIQQQAVEGSLLMAVAAGMGVWITLFVPQLLAAFPEPLDLTLHIDTRMDLRVFLFTVTASLVTAVLFTVAPALRVSRISPASVLKSEPSDVRSHRSRQILVGAQVAVSAVLIVVASLLLQSLSNLQNIDTELDSRGVLVVSIDLQTTEMSSDEALDFERRLTEGILSLPGITAAATAPRVPLSQAGSTDPVIVPDRGPDVQTGHTIVSVSPGYFATLGIPLLRGREFEESDPKSDYVIVNEVFAQQFWGDSDPVGRSIEIPSQDRLRRVLGVTANSKCRRPSEGSGPCVYQPKTRGLDTVLIARANEPLAMIDVIVNEVHRLNSNAVVYEAKTLDESLGEPLAGARLISLLTGVAGAIALMFVAAGLTAVVSFTVSQQQKEIGVRMALGARTQNVMAAFLGSLTQLVLTSCAVGLGLALLLTHMMQGQLYGISFSDPRTYFIVGALLCALSLVAGYIPTRRAARIDPMVALRHD